MRAYYAYDDKEIDMIKKEHNWDAPLIQRFKGLGEMSSETAVGYNYEPDNPQTAQGYAF